MQNPNDNNVADDQPRRRAAFVKSDTLNTSLIDLSSFFTDGVPSTTQSYSPNGVVTLYSHGDRAGALHVSNPLSIPINTPFISSDGTLVERIRLVEQ
jgi:hypothetical protein